MENFPLVGLLILGYVYVMDYFPIIMIGLGVLVVVLAFRTEKKTPKK